jgi:hypothetical protein
MGYGAFMHVTNNRANQIQLFITDVTCVYDNGDQGSDLSLFNNATVPAASQLPSSGNQYIEARNSGDCFLAPSYFTLKVEDKSNDAIIGSVVFEETSDNWDVSSNSNTDVIDVDIDNSGDQARIAVTVEATS